MTLVAKVVNKIGINESRVIRYFRETRAELRKVVWPTRQETINLTGIVLAVTLAMSALLGLIDLFFSRVFALLIR
jgi:preprotein translocase subunit SecE